MKRQVLTGILLTVMGTAQAQVELWTNVNGYTINSNRQLSQFSQLAIDNGKVLYVGNDDIRKRYPDAKLHDAQGKTMLPGLIDGHGHIMGLGNNLMELDLRGLNKAQTVAAIAQYAKQNPDLSVIRGRGWNQEIWRDAVFPTAADIDAVVSDKPVILSRVDGHAIWVNSAAMALADISASTVNPEGGEVTKSLQGEPLGVFVDNAESLITRHLPAADAISQQKALNLALNHLASLGITSVHDAGIDAETWRLYQQYLTEQKLTTRIYAMYAATDSQLPQILSKGTFFEPSDRLVLRSVKVYADGALGSRGAALLRPYSDIAPSHSGLMLYSKEQLQTTVNSILKAGFQANTHAIGDGANHTVLDVYATAFKKVGGKALRNRIEHAQIVDEKDIHRFHELSVIPSMQPVHATSDMHMAPKRLGQERLAGAYAWRWLLDEGNVIVAGSDFPVELANVFHGIYAAVTRSDQTGAPKGGWLAGQVLTRSEALRAFTLDAAYGAFMEHKIGSLEQGKWADFILVDRDIFTVPEHEIWQTQVLSTYVAGEPMFVR